MWLPRRRRNTAARTSFSNRFEISQANRTVICSRHGRLFDSIRNSDKEPRAKSIGIVDSSRLTHIPQTERKKPACKPAVAVESLQDACKCYVNVLILFGILTWLRVIKFLFFFQYFPDPTLCFLHERQIFLICTFTSRFYIGDIKIESKRGNHWQIDQLNQDSASHLRIRILSLESFRIESFHDQNIQGLINTSKVCAGAQGNEANSNSRNLSQQFGRKT